MTWTPSRAVVLRQAVQQARLAPSIHNTQPWRFGLSDDRIVLHSDPRRRLDVLDPTGRQMLLSCGCALFNIRVSLAADAVPITVSRLLEPTHHVVAEVRVTGDTETPAETEIAALAPAIPLRQTNRRRFTADPVPEDVVRSLEAAASAEGARLVLVRGDDARMAVARLSQRADALEMADPAYRAELRRWTSDDPARTDGVPASVVPHVDAGSGDEIPIRDFDTHGSGWLPTTTHSSRDQCLFLLCTDEDQPEAWLRAGEALERVWLEVTRQGFAMGVFTQVVEVPSARNALRSELRLGGLPHVLLRVGRAPVTGSTPRRPLAELLTPLA